MKTSKYLCGADVHAIIRAQLIRLRALADQKYACFDCDPQKRLSQLKTMSKDLSKVIKTAEEGV